ncbi:MAG: hypothetical protein AAGB12_11615 [Pseudomonadota bacterium]
MKKATIKKLTFLVLSFGNLLGCASFSSMPKENYQTQPNVKVIKIWLAPEYRSGQTKKREYNYVDTKK